LFQQAGGRAKRRMIREPEALRPRRCHVEKG
jgi:hypothetical protein